MTAARFLIISFCALGLSGCATARHPSPQAAAIPVSTLNRPAAAVSGTGAVLPSVPEPVYRNPKIGIVYLRPYEDAQGRLFGPQVMYQVTDPGGWNLDAVETGNGFIPAANVEVPAGLVSPYAMPAREVKPSLPEQPLLDPESAARIIMTGLMRPEDRPQAEAMARQAGAGFSAVFDSEAGWLVVPPERKGAGP